MSRPTILAYHAVGPVRPVDDPLGLYLTPDVFEMQMQLLKERCRVIPLKEATAHTWEVGQPRVAVTFDDGYRCLLEHALPVLERLGFHATFFIPTGAIGDCNRWDLDPPPDGLDVMTRDDLREVDARGFGIESHGHRHIDLSAAAGASVRDDLVSSVDSLTEILGRAPRFLAYPWGQVSKEVECTAASLGFDAAFTIGVRGRGPLALARVPIRRANSMWQFHIQRSGYWPALRFSRIGSPVRATARGAVRRTRSKR